MDKIVEFITMIFNNICHYFKEVCKPELKASLLVMLIIAILAIVLGAAIKKADPKKAPKGLAFAAETVVSFTDDQIKENLGTAYLKFGPYMVFLYLYVPLAFVIGLFGFASPMTYSTIPICLALVTWLGIQISAIYYQKWDYLKGFTSPLPTWLPVFVPINILSKFSPLLSLSMRLLGNAVSGYILMYLVYWATGLASEAISGLAGANFIGVVIAPFLHAYFDAFGAFVQTTIFTTLTMLLIATEIPAPVNVDINKKSKKEIKKAQRALKKAQKA